MSRQHRIGLALVVVAVSAGSAAAATVGVTDYSWLQLAPGSVTPLVGGAVASPTNAHGAIDDYRWGHFVWVPHRALTGDGQAMYYGGVKLDKARLVEQVLVEAWATGNEQLQKYYVDGSTDGGTTWTNIGSQDYGTMKTDRMLRQTVDVTDGVYDAVRVRFEPGDYQALNVPTNYGGPGLYVVEPIGDGTLEVGDRVNYANQPNFGTGVAYNLTDAHSDRRYGNQWVSGLLADGNPYIGWNGDMVAGEYLEVQLKEERTIDSALALGAGGYTPHSFTVEVSTDGLNFTPVTAGLSGPTYYTGAPTSWLKAGCEYTFDPVQATHVRLTDVTVDSGGYLLITQVLVNGTLEEEVAPIPEPATMALVGLGAFGLLRRRRR